VSASYNRRNALAVIAAGAAAFVRPAPAADFAWRRFKGTKVRFMVSIHPWTDWAHRQLADLEAATGVEVDWEILYEDQFRQKLPLTLRADPGAVDGFFTLPSWDGAAFARANWYQPLDPYIRSDLTSPDWDYSDFFPNILNVHNVAGAQIGISITIELQTLFFNQAMLQQRQVGVPRTLEEMLGAAKALDDRNHGVAGYVTRGDGVQAVYTIAPFLFAFGGRWLDEKGNPELASQAFVNALRFYGDILRAAGPPNILGMQWKFSYPLFQQGRAAMFTDATNLLAYFKDASQSKIVDQVGVAPLPAGPAGSHGTVISWGPAIAASSNKKEAAWYVIQYLTSRAMAAAATEATHLPPSRQSVYNSDVFVKSVPADMIDAIKQGIPNAVPNGANALVVPVPEVRAAIGSAIVAVLQGGNAEKVANDAQRRVQQILKG
jgi:multiple sugar transport system substrate-binding protein